MASKATWALKAGLNLLRLFFIFRKLRFSTLTPCPNFGEYYTWEELPNDHDIVEFVFIDTLTGFGISGSDTIFKTVDAGKTWQASYIDDLDRDLFITYYSSIEAVDSKYIWITGITYDNNTGEPALSRILYSEDDGLHWENKSFREHNNGAAQIYFFNKDSAMLMAGVAFGQDNFYFTTDRGENWTKSTVFPEFIYTLFILNETTAWAGGQMVHRLRCDTIVDRESIVQESPDILVFPNPCTDKLFINTTEKILNINLYDYMGQLCKNAVYQGDVNQIQTDLNQEYFYSGIYTLEIITQDGTYKFKIIKE